MNVSESGVLTVDVTSGTPSNFSYSWYFWGSANGQFAYASGTGQGSGNADHLTLTLAAANISSWNIPGFQEPIHVKTAYLDRSSGFFFFTSLYSLTLHDFVDFPQPIVAGVPVRVFPARPRSGDKRQPPPIREFPRNGLVHVRYAARFTHVAKAWTVFPCQFFGF